MTFNVNPGGQRTYYVSAYTTQAAGTDATHDTAAIQSAIDACNTAGGGTVLLDEALYLLETGSGETQVCIVAKDNVKLTGLGRNQTTLQIDQNETTNPLNAIQNVTSIDNAEFCHFKLDGNKDRLAESTWGSENEGIDLKTPSNCYLHDLWVVDCVGDAIDMDSPGDDNVVDNCLIEDNGGCSVHWSGAVAVSNITSKRNSWYRLQNATQSVRAAAGAISYSGDGAIISNIQSENDQRAITCVGGGYSLVSNVTIVSPSHGGTVTTGTWPNDPATDATPNGSGQGVYIAGATGIQLSNIVFSGRSSLAGEAGILVKGSTTRGIQVDGAFIKTCYYGMWLDDIDGGQFNNITVLSPSSRGILVDGCTPQDDIVINNPVVRGGSGGGIRIDGTSDSVRINDPIVYDVTASGGIYFINAASDCTVNGGRITGCQRGIYMSGSGGDVDQISIKNIELIGNTTANLQMRNTGEANNTFLQNVFMDDGPQAVSITAATDTFEAENEVIELSADGVYTMSAAALISNSFKEGQILTLINTGANTITLTNGNDFRFKGGANLALAQYDSVRVIRNAAIGDWVEI